VIVSANSIADDDGQPVQKSKLELDQYLKLRVHSGGGLAGVPTGIRTPVPPQKGYALDRSAVNLAAIDADKYNVTT
jgi:hypothetical protein